MIPFLLQILGCSSDMEKHRMISEDKLNSSGIVLSEFIFEEAPFTQCHASTIAETQHGLVAAWFGGTKESQPDVSTKHGPTIWARRGAK
jgi:predicted neuraminidase